MLVVGYCCWLSKTLFVVVAEPAIEPVLRQKVVIEEIVVVVEIC
jgi:hypothetical protein